MKIKNLKTDSKPPKIIVRNFKIAIPKIQLKFLIFDFLSAFYSTSNLQLPKGLREL